ncbi:unnamed protein product [Cyprideis torosa]|uniref:isoleucine--tRNA ligase n=1 Tax=Cyprideis torosa TaxID=163714 RepID=A0A7R8WE14_9CRUS|nr:unnamed protein product [Cyprideis torosa]CAG0895225.1 unnamed protein product [Cyprideis torosa]
MGHAANKILKDVINRYKLLSGHRVHFRPGWDCHGLPIELKANDGGIEADPLVIRRKCRQFAEETWRKQREIFQQWGLMGDWDYPYLTMSPEYMAKEIALFQRFHERDLIFRALMPVHWSPSSRTALAEAELVYKEDHISPSTYVSFPILSHPFTDVGPIHALVWTTTPWTLPANKAIAFNPHATYCLVQRNEKKVLLVAQDLLAELQPVLGPLTVVLENISGKSLADLRYQHPLFPGEDRFRLLPGRHVKVDKGTGLVHTAPAHGREDFLLAQEHGLSTTSEVDEAGKYKAEVGIESLVGKEVLSEGNRMVKSLMEEHIELEKELIHSYPYDWRTDEPVIYRASQQWFLDTDRLKEPALQLLSEIQILPDHYLKTLENQILSRPYWCISRQRVWGTPIPVMYRKEDGTPILSAETIQHHLDLLGKHGPDFWWECGDKELLPPTYSGVEAVKGKDIFDIWIDSGMTWHCADLPSEPIDVILEGVDQFRGWFQSSLLTYVAKNEVSASTPPPFRSIVVHGFVLDGEGKKMSKSLGNVVSPSDITHRKNVHGNKNYLANGVDELRMWAACYGAGGKDILCGEEQLKESNRRVVQLRLILKFLIGVTNSTPFSPLTKYEEFLPLDKLLLHQLYCHNREVRSNYEKFQINYVVTRNEEFLQGAVSPLISTMKDRLYCDLEDSLERRSALTALKSVLQQMIFAIAPLMPYLGEEAYGFFMDPGLWPDSLSIFHQTWPKIPVEWENPDLEQRLMNVFKLKNQMWKEVTSKGLQSSKLDAWISGSDEFLQDLIFGVGFFVWCDRQRMFNVFVYYLERTWDFTLNENGEILLGHHLSPPLRVTSSDCLEALRTSGSIGLREPTETASSLSPLTSHFFGLPRGPEDERINRTSRAHRNRIISMAPDAAFSESLSRGCCKDQRTMVDPDLDCHAGGVSRQKAADVRFVKEVAEAIGYDTRQWVASDGSVSRAEPKFARLAES